MSQLLRLPLHTWQFLAALLTDVSRAAKLSRVNRPNSFFSLVFSSLTLFVSHILTLSLFFLYFCVYI